jgi:hypothetical protein
VAIGSVDANGVGTGIEKALFDRKFWQDAADTEAARVRGLISTNANAIGSIDSSGNGSGMLKDIYDNRASITSNTNAIAAIPTGGSGTGTTSGVTAAQLKLVSDKVDINTSAIGSGTVNGSIIKRIDTVEAYTVTNNANISRSTLLCHQPFSIELA